MIEIGERITEFGYSVIPYSFFAFLLVRLLEFLWGIKISKLVKSLWYLSLGILLLAGDTRVDTIVMLIAFVESYDLFLQHFEDKRNKET